MTITPDDSKSLKPQPAMKRLFMVGLLLLVSGLVVFFLFREKSHREKWVSSWWPAQQVASGFVSAAPSGDFGEKILLQGLSGLAAQAVNENRGDEIVWLPAGADAYPEWKGRTLQRLKLEDRGQHDVWTLLKRYHESGLVKGYVVYRRDSNPERAYEGKHNKLDLSLNVATTLAGLLHAVPVEVSLESRVQSMGIKKLEDATAITPEALLKDRGKELKRTQLVVLDPRAVPMRDFSIAHNGFVDSMGNDTPPVSLKWVEPLAPAIGWFIGDEFKNVAPMSRAGHMHTASNWANNIPFLSMGSADYQPRKLRALDPSKIRFDSTRASVAFMVSDGDNVCWMLGGFQSPNQVGKPSSFWDSPEHGKFPMGWSACLGDLVDIAPVVLDRLAETQPTQTTVTQFGGGYFYPDLFAMDLPNRIELLRRHARRIGAQMRRTGAVTLTFICEKSDSPAALEAMRIFAEEIQPLLGMLVMDYAPYNRMQGAVYWVPDGRGGEVPAVTPRYSLWAGLNRPRSGGQKEIAAAVMEDVSTPGDSWVAVHAWSKFDGPSGPKTLGGINAVAECISGLDSSKVQVVTPEEMLWRIRYAHNPVETRKLITIRAAAL